MESHRIVINVDSNKKYSSKTHLVLPGLQFVKEGDEVIFNARNSEVTLFIPNADELFDQLPKNYTKLIQEKSDLLLKIKSTVSNKPRAFPYAVFCILGTDFAEGNSSPKIIVD